MKRFILIITLVLTFTTIINPSTVSAVELSAGVTTWYAWWDFPGSAENAKMEIDPSLLYGPALSLKISDNYNLTFLFLYGKFNVNETGSEYISGEWYSWDIDYDMRRIDSDMALNYRLNNYFKIYMGLKYTHYKFTSEIPENNYSFELNHYTIGPGAGISLVMPLGGNFYFIGNAGGFYLWGNEESTDSTGVNETNSCEDYGFNSTVSIAYYIADASTTINLGGRYQFVKLKAEDVATENTKFYGITLSATYSFSI